MPKKIRNKLTRNQKSNNIEEHILHDSSASTSLEEINPLPCLSIISSASKKRPVELSEEERASNSEDNEPPRKKLNYTDLTRIQNKRLKRALDVSENDYENYNQAKIKAPKIEKCYNILNKRFWKESVRSFETEDGSSHFVIATYNMLSDLESTNQFICNTTKNSDKTLDNMSQHLLLMQELDFINADILCLQEVRYSYWKDTLEFSLKDRGYYGDISIGDKISNVGIATVYLVSRFVKVDIDSNKLSKLCVEQIPSDCGLDEATLCSIKQYLDEPDSYILTVLKDKQIKDGRLLIVGNTQLSSHSTDKQDLRCVQAVGVFWQIHRMITQIKSDLNNNGIRSENLSAPCWILCGDFYSNSDSPLYQICRDGYPDENSIIELQSVKKVSLGDSHQSSSLVDLIWHSFQHPLTDSCSSYLKALNYEPSKDYIWMSEAGLHAHKVLMPCSTEYHASNTSMGPNNNNRLPSHNVSLACDISFMT